MSNFQTINIMPAGHSLVGRDAFIEQIFTAIKTSSPNANVLLTGPQGIGKTAICQQLVHYHRTEFTDIIWLNGQSSIAEQLSALVAPCYDVPVDDPSWSYQLMENLETITNPSLIFIDNISAEQVESAEFGLLLKLNWHIIATAEQSLDHFDFQFEVEPLNPDDGCKLFLQYNPQLELTPEQQQQLALSHYHPLTLELQAKQTNCHQLTVEQWSFDPASLLTKHCSTEQQQLLRLIAIMPYEYYPLSDWIDWLGKTIENSLNTLEQQGWIEQAEMNQQQYFALQPLLSETIKRNVTLELDALVNFATSYNQSIALKANQTWLSQAHCLPQIHALEHSLDLLHPNALERQNSIDLVKADLLTTQAEIERAHTHFDKAIALHQQALSLYHHVHGKQHDKVLTSLSHVSAIYLSKGNQKLGYKMSDKLLSMLDVDQQSGAEKRRHYLAIIISEITDSEVVDHLKQKYQV